MIHRMTKDNSCFPPKGTNKIGYKNEIDNITRNL